MFDTVSASFRWLWSLGGRFFRVAPGPTLFVIPATLVSQVSMLLAFLLPLKVLILVGSEGLPGYFPEVLTQFGRDTLIISLSIVALGAYLLHIAMEKLIHWASNVGAQRLLVESQKVALFNNQDKIAAASYRRYASALANTVFIACVWLTFAIISPALCVLVVSYTALCAVGIGFAHGSNETLGRRIEKGLNSLLSALTALGFLLVFFLLVMQFLTGSAQNFLLALISLILARQAFNRVNQLVLAIVDLYGKRRNLNALFFSGHILSRVDNRQEEFWALFALQTREAWLRELLFEQLEIEPKQLSVSWHQTGVSGLVALAVEAQGAESELIGRYLIRVYERTPSLLASHEATLLLDDSSEYLPALSLLAIGWVGRWHCHIFALPEGCLPVKAGAHTAAYLAALCAFEPPQDLAARYARSHPMLWQRLDTSLIERLAMAAGPDGEALVRNFEERLPSMLTALQGLPLVVVNPDINANTLMQDAAGELRVTYWGRWTLEPLGSGWALSEKSLENLPKALQEASEQRPALQTVDVQAVALAALLFKFDRCCTGQLYLDALEMIPQLLEVDSQRV